LKTWLSCSAYKLVADTPLKDNR